MFDAYRAGRVDEAARDPRVAAAADRRALCDDQPDSDQVGDEQARFPCRRLPAAARRHAGRAGRPLASADRAVRVDGPAKSAVDRIEILGCRLDAIDADEAAARILDARATSGTGAQVVTLGTEMVVYAQKDERFRAIVNASALSLCDTVGLLAVARRAARRCANASPASN